MQIVGLHTIRPTLVCKKYPSGTIYRRPFPNTHGRCTSLPCGILKAEIASMLATQTEAK
jgi:hypothetical protein